MNVLSTDPDALMDEVTRYLAVIDAFRAAGCEPTWRAESMTIAVEPERDRRSSRIEKSAH